MFAIIAWVDGFGNDGYVRAIYRTFEEAEKHCQEGERWVQFDFGEVDFDWYEATPFKSKSKKRKKSLTK